MEHSTGTFCLKLNVAVPHYLDQKITGKSPHLNVFSGGMQSSGQEQDWPLVTGFEGHLPFRLFINSFGPR
ncbi:hypothetical protein UPYG_G00090390 [Umbra pygmaea]|uniref:Uncharacterized protein n=1 Tax=Umbra pygmaea TaxID=75934 RepID=A0ABD0XIA7_UMBPY